MSKQLKILVGTVTGNAELVAEEMQYTLQDDFGWQVQVLSMDGLDAEALAPDAIYLVCSSTYGVGDLPDNAQDFFDEVAAKKPDLSWLRYGIYSLGDSVYSGSFCLGGEHFDTLFSGLGATRIGEIGRHDASEDDLAEDCGAAWVRGWIELTG